MAAINEKKNTMAQSQVIIKDSEQESRFIKEV